MNSLPEKLASIDLAAIVVAEGIELRRSRQRYLGRCPFHEDKTPSFTVKENRFKCFGCNASGDAIDFIQQLRGLSFRDACLYLGITLPGRPATKAECKQVEIAWQRRKHRAELVERFRQWEARYSSELGKRIRRAYRWITKYVKTPEDLNGSTGDMLQEIYNHLPFWEERLQTLACGTDEQKFDLYKEVNNVGQIQTDGRTRRSGK
ncbi:MAG: hypothetical protein D4R73_06525 [Deltaproteobacteria bacterium]|nr:MAG: hypothetical protein D4R73_06525 [Deltaproteobacteria bacterium]